MFPMNLENQQFLESQDNTYNLITLILGVLPNIKIDICLTNDLYKNGHKVFVTNNQKHEKTQVFNQLKDKLIVICIQTEWNMTHQQNATNHRYMHINLENSIFKRANMYKRGNVYFHLYKALEKENNL